MSSIHTCLLITEYDLIVVEGLIVMSHEDGLRVD